MRHVATSGWIGPAGRLATVLMTVLVVVPVVRAHCDGMDGPVVAAARKALAAGDARYALVWVQQADEGEVRQAFERTMAVRKLGAEAKELADHYFFETLVRIHRAGEGAPYTGLKPAGRDLGPAIPAADRALESGSVEPAERLLTDAVTSGLRERFREAAEAKSFTPNDVGPTIRPRLRRVRSLRRADLPSGPDAAARSLPGGRTSAVCGARREASRSSATTGSTRRGST